MKSGLCLGLALLLFAPGGGFAAEEDAVRDIGDRRELFVDDWLIDKASGAALRLNPPTPRETVLPLNQPWAGPTTGYTTVFKDGDRYRFYASNDDYGSRVPDYTSYAESKDGVTWTMPKLGLVEFQGSKDNNIIWAEKGIHSFNAFRDENPRAPPEQRYKACAGGPPRLFVSADGIRWKKLQEKPVLTDGPDDSQNVVFWDARRGLYVAYARLFKGDIRDVRTATSPDFVNWTRSRPVEFGAAPVEHLYTNAVTPYFRAPHLYVGFPMRFVPDRQLAPKHPYKGVSDGIFMSSRDGLHFRRFPEAFIRPDLGIRNWTDRTNLPTWGVVPTGPEEMSVYWVEHFRHPTIGLRRGSLPLDRFASAHASPAGGEFTTRPLHFKGSKLLLNFATSAPGSVRVAVLDRAGAEVPGFGLSDCPDLYGNEIERAVTWKGGADLGRLAGQPVRLRFRMKDADLYALRFAP